MIEKNLYKYGVISKKNFEISMSNLNNLFFCGLFQKPVETIFANVNYDKLIENNRKSAFALVALKNKENVQKEEFYEDIINISYI